MGYTAPPRAQPATPGPRPRPRKNTRVSSNRSEQALVIQLHRPTSSLSNGPKETEESAHAHKTCLSTTAAEVGHDTPPTGPHPNAPKTCFFYRGGGLAIPAGTHARHPTDRPTPEHAEVLEGPPKASNDERTKTNEKQCFLTTRTQRRPCVGCVEKSGRLCLTRQA